MSHRGGGHRPRVSWGPAPGAFEPSGGRGAGLGRTKEARGPRRPPPRPAPPSPALAPPRRRRPGSRSGRAALSPRRRCSRALAAAKPSPAHPPGPAPRSLCPGRRALRSDAPRQPRAPARRLPARRTRPARAPAPGGAGPRGCVGPARSGPPGSRTGQCCRGEGSRGARNGRRPGPRGGLWAALPRSASGEGPSRHRSGSGPPDPTAPRGLVLMGKDKLFCACPIPFPEERFLALPCQMKVCCIRGRFTVNPESVSVCFKLTSRERQVKCEARMRTREVAARAPKP